VFVVLGLTVLLVAVGVVQRAVESGLGPDQLLAILPYIIPSLLPFTIPAALLFTVCLVYGRMAGDQEVIAAKAAGISVMSLLAPGFLLGGVLSVASLVLTDQVIPWAVANIEREIVEAVEDVFLERLKADRQFVDKSQGITVTVNDVEGRVLIRPIFRLEQRSDDGQVRFITLQAAEAELKLDPAAQEAIIRIRDGIIQMPGDRMIRIRDEDTRRIRWNHFSTASTPRNLPVQVIRAELSQLQSRIERLEDRQTIREAMALTLARLEEYGRLAGQVDPELKVAKNRTNRLSTEVQSRFALACGCFFFVLLGAPIAILRANGHFLVTFGSCFLPITVMYYPLAIGIAEQAKGGRFPVFTLWAGNLVLCVLGLLVIRRLRKH
jgi:lipopolysaccharide export system permease protein